MMGYNVKFIKRYLLPVLCVLFICLFLRERLMIQSRLSDEARGRQEPNVTVTTAKPPCRCTAPIIFPIFSEIKSETKNKVPKSDTNNDKNIARINDGVEFWVRRVDPHNYSYVINPSRKCEKQKFEGEELLLVIFVNSAPDHFLKRNVIRNTFGRQSAWPFFVNHNQSMRIVFLLGAVKDDFLQSQIRDESMIYDDIVQENFTDDYLNLTLKTIMGMKWTSTYCRRAKFVMKMDDDVLINTPVMSRILQNAFRKGFSLGEVNTAPIVRLPRGLWAKFYTPTHLWPYREFPPFFTGTLYIFSMDIVDFIYQMALETPLFPWSDVFVGMCCEKLNINLRHQPGFVTCFQYHPARDQPLPSSPKDIEAYRKLYAAFHLSPLHVPTLWEIWTNRTAISA